MNLLKIRSKLKGKDLLIEDCKIYKGITCKSSDSILKVSKLLAKHSSKQVILIGNKGNLEGLVTLSDIVYKGIAKSLSPSSKIVDVAVTQLFTLDKKESLIKAYLYMISRNRLFCPVVSNNKFVGLISLSDVFRLLRGGK